jgi:hypothetical protein
MIVVESTLEMLFTNISIYIFGQKSLNKLNM